MRTTPDEVVPWPYDETAMNSSSAGGPWRPSARAKSAMNMTAPLSTHDQQQPVVDVGVVGGDLLGQLVDLLADLLLGDDHVVDVGVVPGAVSHAPKPAVCEVSVRRGGRGHIRCVWPPRSSVIGQ